MELSAGQEQGRMRCIDAPSAWPVTPACGVPPEKVGRPRDILAAPPPCAFYLPGFNNR
jgi:hypothetical protein